MSEGCIQMGPDSQSGAEGATKAAQSRQSPDLDDDDLYSASPAPARTQPSRRINPLSAQTPYFHIMPRPRPAAVRGAVRILETFYRNSNYESFL